MGCDFNINIFYASMPRKSRGAFREFVCKKCGWSYPLFYYKMSRKAFSNAEEFYLRTIVLEYKNAQTASLR